MLRQAWETSPNGEGTLRGQLIVFEAQANNLVNSATVTSTASSGRTVSVAPARQGEKTALETADTWTQLIDLFDSVTASQLALSPAGATDDQTIFNLMMVAPEMRGIANFTSNFMWLSK